MEYRDKKFIYNDVVYVLKRAASVEDQPADITISLTTLENRAYMGPMVAHGIVIGFLLFALIHLALTIIFTATDYQGGALSSLSIHLITLAAEVIALIAYSTYRVLACLRRTRGLSITTVYSAPNTVTVSAARRLILNITWPNGVKQYALVA